ncbi:type 1 glutamine amidotransferase domain-containing protein [Bifidobacterium mongoliense]|jgi:protease I|uniref:4-methyl-5(Beta-hydroxyethyl)-thiazole monophosphate synthesis protein n=2 Tax=Bifidobacterium mongoliense TaxID=518643 RepID=A0A087CAQ5_9BIFI|nr:type 1 glutamine amidotransferase domain-containing protein [Bifidobacterium mongoliense]KFI80355.1 4-methyl-5(beta-hydroxyethyl)-thiazole monophosphate synthesis protein [Bifidobacterium mongoliense DSM 21395]MDN5978785.1 type 1 glutamine amidotransferase [Bifidobacterium mongoliense]MDN6025065.1 type 1 glutamine amidotransferase [Bifidobacterium mongoliense]MDN6050767.1 type 1 glutamine amidotransferase [Bifidobacterium mongoliense]MDN6484476.1 type 1 glutamine amidotransferase [Bifidobac
MTGSITTAKVLIITQNWGIEETELTRPLRDLRKAGARVTLAAAEQAPVETLQHDRYEGERLDPDTTYDQVHAEDYDLLVVPGGTTNVDRLRVAEDPIALAQAFAKAGKPIAAICHGAWLLVNADLLGGKTLTSTRYIKRDVENAGGVQVNEPVHIDDAQGWRLITSRKPDDLDAFVGAIKDTLG